jgi:hypothetical protein
LEFDRIAISLGILAVGKPLVDALLGYYKSTRMERGTRSEMTLRDAEGGN